MSKSVPAFIGSIYSSHKKCDCGGEFERHPHHKFVRDDSGKPILAPFCADCGEIAQRLLLIRREGPHTHKISYDKAGQPLTTMDQVVELARQITKEINNCTFDPTNYYHKGHAGSISESISAFINREVLKHFPEKDSDPDYLYLRDFLAPYFVDVGVFAACEAHISFFIRDMGLIKTPQREYAKRLWKKVLELARPSYEPAKQAGVVSKSPLEAA